METEAEGILERESYIPVAVGTVERYVIQPKNERQVLRVAKELNLETGEEFAEVRPKGLPSKKIKLTVLLISREMIEQFRRKCDEMFEMVAEIANISDINLDGQVFTGDEVTIETSQMILLR